MNKETALTAPNSRPAHGLALRGPAGREFPIWLPKATATPQQVMLIEATQAIPDNPAVAELDDTALDQLVIKGTTEAGLLLGLTRMVADKLYMSALVTPVGNMLRRKHRYLRQQEVPLVFRLGAEGEFRREKDNVLPLSLEMFSLWFARYRDSVRAQALLNAEVLDDSPPKTILPSTHPLVLRYSAYLIIAGVHKVAATGKYEDFDEGSTLYETLKYLGLFDALYTKEEKWGMWQEELEVVKKNLTGHGIKKRIETFQDALAELGRPPDRDPITHATIRACQKRTMKQWVLSCVANETDVGNLLMHLVETQQWQPPELPPEP